MQEPQMRIWRNVYMGQNPQDLLPEVQEQAKLQELADQNHLSWRVGEEDGYLEMYVDGTQTEILKVLEIMGHHGYKNNVVDMDAEEDQIERIWQQYGPDGLGLIGELQEEYL